MKKILMAIKLKRMGYKFMTYDQCSLEFYKNGWKNCEMYEILPKKFLIIAYGYQISDSVTIRKPDYKAMRAIAKYNPEMCDNIKMYEKMEKEFI